MAFEVAKEDRSALELASAGPLREVARDNHRVEPARRDQSLDRINVRGNGVTTEMQVADVQQSRQGAATRSATCSPRLAASPSDALAAGSLTTTPSQTRRAARASMSASLRIARPAPFGPANESS